MDANIGNPFEKINNIETSQELLDIAFEKSLKTNISSRTRSAIERSRNHELNRINTAANVIVDRIERIISQFPTIENIHPFYQEMADLFCGTDELKISLSRVHGITKAIRSIQDEVKENLIITEHKDENRQLRKQAFGRFSSLVYRIQPFLEDLIKARNNLRTLPSFNPYHPTVVISGIPNAGKSSFIKSVTSGNPEIAPYPFTTKSIIFGHRPLKFFSIQFVDTPGLLDRDFLERNDIELQAILALQYLSDLLLYFIDPSDGASNNISHQINLLKQIQEYYPSSDPIIVITKNDLVDSNTMENLIKLLEEEKIIKNSKYYSINTVTKQGSENLVNDIENIIEDLMITNPKFKTIDNIEIDPEFIQEEEDPFWRDY